MTKRDQSELTRKVQRDMFADRATIEGPMFQPGQYADVDQVSAGSHLDDFGKESDK